MPLTSNPGICTHCLEEVPINANKIISHLKHCKGVPVEKRKFVSNFSLLRIKDKYDFGYWMVIYIKDSVTLEELNIFLKDIWLRCCDHLSAFMIDRAELDYDMTISKLAKKCSEFDYQYDFGSTTSLNLSFLAQYKDYHSEDRNIEILFRNKPVIRECSECYEPAECICWKCKSYGDNGLLCKTHRLNHKCWDTDENDDNSITDSENSSENDAEKDLGMNEEIQEIPANDLTVDEEYDSSNEDYLIELSNSPRDGVCAYSGPNNIYIKKYFPKDVV